MNLWKAVVKAVRPGQQKKRRPTSDGLRKDAMALLAQVERELGAADSASDQIGQHAATCEQKLVAEIAKRRKRLRAQGPNDPKEERAYLYLNGQLRRARQVAAVSRANDD